MTPIDRFERRLPDGLNNLADPRVPSYLNDILADTARARQRPAWSFLERWLPMAVIARRPATAPPLRGAWVLVLAALLGVALVAGGAIVGARLLGVNATAPIPMGGAAVLAFASAEGDVHTVRADGTDLRRLTNGPQVESHPVWSPDGTQIAFLVSEPGTESVAIMDAGGGDRMVLASYPQSCGGGWDPAWSPDGTSLAFASGACSVSDLNIVAVDGTSAALLLLAPGLNGAAPAWAPDGSGVAFVGREPGGTPGVYVADPGPAGALAGGLQARRISSDATDVAYAFNGEAGLTPQWSPDGKEVAISSGTMPSCHPAATGTWDIELMNANGSGQRTVAAETPDELGATWSPDGQQLAFLRIVEQSELLDEGNRACTSAPWVTDANGENQRRLPGLAFDPGPPPSWSPDGSRVAGLFVHVPGVEPTADGLYVITVDGSSPVVTIEVAGGYPSWQPVAAPLPPAPSFGSAVPTP